MDNTLFVYPDDTRIHYIECQPGDPRLEGMQPFTVTRTSINEAIIPRTVDPCTFYTTSRQRAEQLVEAWNSFWDGDFSFTLE